MRAHSFSDYFRGLEEVEAVQQIFGDNTKKVLDSLNVKFTWLGGYMGVNDMTGHLIINSRYLNNGNGLDIYLDLIHELVHVR